MSQYTFPLALKDTAALLRRLPSVWGVWGKKRLDPHLREEVMVAVAAAIGCRYCTFSHREIVLQSGDDLLALAEHEQIEDPDERVFAAIVWAQSKVEANFGPAPTAIERELRSRFDDRECRDIETVAIRDEVDELLRPPGRRTRPTTQRSNRRWSSREPDSDGAPVLPPGDAGLRGARRQARIGENAPS